MKDEFAQIKDAIQEIDAAIGSLNAACTSILLILLFEKFAKENGADYEVLQSKDDNYIAEIVGYIKNLNGLGQRIKNLYLNYSERNQENEKN